MLLLYVVYRIIMLEYKPCKNEIKKGRYNGMDIIYDYITVC